MSAVSKVVVLSFGMMLSMSVPAMAQARGNAPQPRKSEPAADSRTDDESRRRVAGIIRRTQARLQQIHAATPALRRHRTTPASLAARVGAAEQSVAELTASIAALRAELDAIQSGGNGDLPALQAQVEGLVTLINTQSSQLSAMQQQVTQLTQFQANLEAGSCSSGEVVTGVAAGGALVCGSAGGGTLQTYVATALFDLVPGENHLSVSCTAGYQAVSAGYKVPSVREAVTFVDGVSLQQDMSRRSDLTTLYRYTVSSPWWTEYTPFTSSYYLYWLLHASWNSLSVPATTVAGNWTDAATAYVDVDFNPRSVMPLTAIAQATCARVQ